MVFRVFTKLKSYKINEEELLSELPLLLVLSLAYTSYHDPLLLALNEIEHDDKLRRALPNTYQLANLYTINTKLYGNPIIALKNITDNFRNTYLKTLFNNYIASLTILGKGAESLNSLIRNFLEVFNTTIREKMSLLLASIELISLTSVVIVLTIVFSSILYESNISYITAMLVGCLAIPLSYAARLTPLKVYTWRKSARSIFYDLLHIILTLSILISTLMKNPPIRTYYMHIGVISFLLYLSISSIYDIIKRLKVYRTTIEILRIVAYSFSSGSSKTEYLVRVIKDYSTKKDTVPQQIIYTLRTGRQLASNNHGLTYIVTKLIALLIRGGRDASKTLVIATDLLDTVTKTLATTLYKGLVYILLSGISLGIISFTIVYVSNLLTIPTQTQIIPELSPTPASEASIILPIIAIGLVTSYAISFATTSSMRTNIASPLLILIYLYTS